jgi:hypothetical protein
MRMTPGHLGLLVGLLACAARSEESKEESTKVATDTLVETKQVVDTMVVRTDTTIASDTTHIGDQGVVSVDTTKVDSTKK